MLKLLKKIVGLKDTNLLQLIKDDATIVDVRSHTEFAVGHAKGSLNIPLETIGAKTENLKNYKHIILCCRSGNRSAMAQRTLKSKGFKNVSNGGSWQHVNQYLH